MSGSAGRKGSSPKISSYYKVKDGAVTRLRKNCSRCGKGVYMSDHANRRTCGKCGLTEFSR